ncbi:NAD(P)/FAD-dependent oxidoreductase [Litchfieldia alkalitelluris]|uniref:NAD(P)/FAD-dependent oxidoreductase n=1 Tax=Litchfieldia alkalitelluris TaxID=304268 RepID=UPI0009980A03|nr:FAD-binding oxidoreductase [Litchfieldia alkalitelluris]
MRKYIVVGGGILGASTAYHLSKAGANVVLIDRNDKGQATDAAAGIVCPWISQRRNKAWYTLAKNGAKFYHSLIEKLKEDGETDTGYKVVGAISLHTDSKKLDQMIERAHKRREEAPEIGEITRLTAQETQALFPALSDEYESVHISGAARVNGRALRDSLTRAAKKHGAEVVKGDATLIHDNYITKGVRVEEQTYSAEKVIITSGAWANQLLKPLGIHFLGSFQKAQIIHLQMVDVETDSWPVVMPPNNQYIVSFAEGKIVIGATHEDDTGFDLRVTAGGVLEVLEKALNIAPGLADCTLIETRVGFRPFTPGFLPVIGQVPQYEGLLIANGLGASGLTAGPYLGQQLSKLALGEEVELDLSQYDINGAIQKK